jgi:hypothetical protein
MVALAGVKSLRKIAVYVAEANGAVDRMQGQGAFLALVFAKQPTPVGLTGKVLDVDSPLVHQDIVGYRRYFAIKFKFFAAIVPRGRWGKNLDDYGGIGQDVV